MSESPPRPARAAGRRRPPSKPAVGWMRSPHDPLTDLLLTVPVFLIYHLGILFIDLRNGADLVSTLTFELLDRSLGAYVAVTLGFALALAIAVFVLRRRGSVKPATLLPVLLESTGWAVLMLLLVGWATHQIFAQQVGPEPLTPLAKLVMAAGAGFHEEVVFRVAFFGGGAVFLERVLGWPALRAAVVSAVIAAALFSAVHYVGPLGDAFNLPSFTFRMLAGLYLTGVFAFRGFAVVVYTHAIYDLLVFFVFA